MTLFNLKHYLTYHAYISRSSSSFSTMKFWLTLWLSVVNVFTLNPAWWSIWMHCSNSSFIFSPLLLTIGSIHTMSLYDPATELMWTHNKQSSCQLTISFTKARPTRHLHTLCSIHLIDGHVNNSVFDVQIIAAHSEVFQRDGVNMSAELCETCEPFNGIRIKSHEDKIPEDKIPSGKYPKRTYLILFTEIFCNSRYFNVQ